MPSNGKTSLPWATLFNFETGDLQGWKVVEGELDRIVSDRKSLPQWKDVPYNKQGKYYLSTVDTEDSATNKMTGVIKSLVEAPQDQ